MNINYKKDPDIFSNTAFISYTYFELLEDILNYSIPITPESIIGLSILSESVVFHDELVINNNNFQCSESERELIKRFIKGDVLKYIVDYDVFFPQECSAAEMLENEINIYQKSKGLTDEDVKVHTFYYANQNKNLPIEEKLSTFRIGFYNEEHLLKAMEYELKKEEIAKLHGIPIIRGIYFAEFGKQIYNFSELNREIDNSLPKDFLKQIDNERFRYINKLKKYLGNTYVGLPSIISIVLSRAKDIIDIPNQILSLREEMSKFRKTCRVLEIELRKENNFLYQCKIIDEIENAYNSLEIDGKYKKKRRILKEMVDLFSIDLKSLSVNFGKKIVTELYDKSIQLEVPGYYDLYRKSFDVEDNLSSLIRLFGNEIDEYFIKKLNRLSQKIKYPTE